MQIYIYKHTYIYTRIPMYEHTCMYTEYTLIYLKAYQENVR